MKTPNNTEERTTQEYHKLFDAKMELHRLMRRVIVSTKLGRQIREPDDDLELDIGNGSLGSCGRYGQIRYYPQGVFGEYQLDDDLETINYLIREIKSRFQEFQKARNSHKLEYANGKKKFAQKFFNFPLTEIEKEYTHKK